MSELSSSNQQTNEPADSEKAIPVSNSDQSLSDFEKALEKLEQIVNEMEQGTLTLEQSLDAFEQGVQLTRSCQNSLRQAEQRVTKLMEQGDQVSETPFNP